MTGQTDIRSLLARAGNLPAMPLVAQKAMAIIRDQSSSMEELGRVLSLDASLASLVLRWANSAYYGLRIPAKTVRQAVSHLGLLAVRNVLLASSVLPYLDRPANGYGLNRGDLWHHSIGMAAGARLIALRFGEEIAEEAYTAGLLADIGKLALETSLRSINTSSSQWQGKPFSDIEKYYSGFDHAMIGAEIGRRWNLPSPLLDAIANHHHPSSAAEGYQLAVSVHLADAAMMMLGVGLGCDGLNYTLDISACKKIHWKATDFDNLMERIVPFVEEVDELIRIK